MFGSNKNKAVIEEWSVDLGVIADPQNIGADNVDPINKFVSITSDAGIGIIKTGSTALEVASEYAEMFQGTPQQLTRIDLVKKSYMLNFEVHDWAFDIIKAIMGLDGIDDYSITSPVKTIDLLFYGTGECPPTEYGVKLSNRLVDGTPIYMLFYNGIFRSETVTIQPSGTEHQVTQARMMLLPSALVANTRRNVGCAWIDVTPVSPC